MRFQNFRVAAKLWMAVGVLVVALVAVTSFAMLSFVKTQSDGELALKAVSRRVDAATRWYGLTEANAARTQALVLSNEPVIEAAFKDVIAATSAQISEVQKGVEGMTLSPADDAQLKKIAASRKAMIDLRTQARAMKAESKQAEAMTLINTQYNPSVSTYLGNLRDFVKLQEQALVRTQAEINSATASTFKTAAVGIALILAVLLGGAFWLIRTILHRLHRPTLWRHASLGAISARNLTWKGETSLVTCFAHWWQ